MCYYPLDLGGRIAQFFLDLQSLLHSVFQICLPGNITDIPVFLTSKFQLSLRGLQLAFEWFGYFLVSLFFFFFSGKGNNIIAMEIDPSLLTIFP